MPARWSACSLFALLLWNAALPAQTGSGGASGPVRPELPRLWVESGYPTLPPGHRVLRIPEDFACSHSGLNSAIVAAHPGDEVVINHRTCASVAVPAGGSVVLRAKPNLHNHYIVIRSDGTLPPEGTRVGPADASQMVALKRTTFAGADAAIKTEDGAGYYYLRGLEVTFDSSFPSQSVHTTALVNLGNATQKSEQQQAHHIILAQCYIHGRPDTAVKRGVQLSGKYLAMVDSYVSEIHLIEQDSQAVMGWNGTGPYKIVNNHLEGAAENLIFGGADPAMTNVIAADIEIRRNTFTKPTAWQEPTLPGPRNGTASTGADGSLKANTTYYYTVTAIGPWADKASADSARLPEASATTDSVHRSITLRFTKPAGYSPHSYRIYRTTLAPDGRYVLSAVWSRYDRSPAQLNCDTGDTCTFIDPGEDAEATNVSVGRRGVWTVKNLLELKAAQRVLIDGNTFHNFWEDQQHSAIVFKSVNQSGGCNLCHTSDVTFTHNVVMNVANGFSISGYDYEHHTDLGTQRILVADNLFVNVGANINRFTVGAEGLGVFLQPSQSGGPSYPQDAPRQIVLDHNTVILVPERKSKKFIYVVARNDVLLAWTVQNNIVNGDVVGCGGPGGPTLDTCFHQLTFDHNAIIGASASDYSRWKRGSVFPKDFRATKFTDYENCIANFTPASCALAPDSPGHHAASDGKDLGADISAIQTFQGLTTYPH